MQIEVLPAASSFVRYSYRTSFLPTYDIPIEQTLHPDTKPPYCCTHFCAWTQEEEKEEGPGEEERVVPQTVNQRLLAQIAAQVSDMCWSKTSASSSK